MQLAIPVAVSVALTKVPELRMLRRSRGQRLEMVTEAGLPRFEKGRSLTD